MPQQKKWAKLVSSFMIFSLLTGVSAVGAASVYADTAITATKFSDVPAGHWAEKHIAKLASQGIIKGVNGAFKPNDNISQQEAVALAVRFIGKESEVKTDDAVVFPENFNVSAYFKPYIVLAFQEGLLDRDEEFKLADATPDAAWGTKPASREWITKLIVKAIGKEETAQQLTTTANSFKDGAQIGAGYTGYVNAAVALQLVKGVTTDKFEPQGNITRASIATIFSRAESIYPVTYSGQYTAIYTGQGSGTLNLYQGDKETSVSVGAGTYVYRYDSDKAVALDQLLPNTKLLVIASGSNALYVEQLDDTQQVEKLSGTVDHILPNKLLLFVGDKTLDIDYDSSTVIKDGAGNVIPVSSLKESSKVEIIRDAYRAQPLTLQITVQSAPINMSGKGTVQAVDATQGTLSVTNGDTGTAAMYTVSPQADVIWQGTILDGGLSQLRVGDVVSYDVKDSLVTRITIEQTSEKLVRGEFYSASSDASTIQYVKNAGTAQQGLEAKYLADSVDVSINGLTGTTIADLVKGDLLEITLNDKDQVAAIKVVNRQVNVLAGATVVSYDSDLKALTIKDATNKLVSVYLSDITKMDLNGTTITLNNVASLLQKGKKVTLGYTDNKAVFVQFVYKYEGTVTAINTNSNQLTLLQSGGTSVSIPLDSTIFVEIAGKTSPVLSDVKAGDTITALLNANQDKISNLQVHTTKPVEIYSIDTAGKKLKLKAADGTFYDYSTAGLEITNEKGEKLAITSVAVGQAGNLYFVGNSMSALKMLNVTVGRVASVSANTVSVVDYSGSTVSVPLGTNFSIIKNGVTGSSTASLAVGDRVEVKLDAKDQVAVTVISGIAKSFWKYDSASGVLSVKRASLSETNTYAVTAATKITQNGSPITIGQLADGDAIVLYIYRNALVEIAKA